MVTKLKVEKAQVESSLREEEAKCGMLLKEVKDANEIARKFVFDSATLSLNSNRRPRQSLEKLLSNVKGDSIELENRLQSESLSRNQHERDAEEHKELWEAEIRSRTKLGSKIAEMEKRLAEARVDIEEEKRKTRKALEMKKVLEAKTSDHQKDVVALKTQLKSYKRRFKEYEASGSRIPSLRVEFDKERSAMESHITSLRRQLDNLSERLHQESENRSRVEHTCKQQQQELSATKQHEKRLHFDQERLEQTNRQLEEEVGRLKAFYENNFVEKGQLEAYKQELEAKSRFELNRKLEEAVAREKLDKMREANESKTRKELEMTITDLKSDVVKMRAGFHDSQTQKETRDAEAKRYKDLYESELKSKDKLANRLYKANEKMAESQALLNIERSRRNFDGLQRDTSPHQFTSDTLGGLLNSSSTTSP
ncbi:hypothetical protein OS493_033131 [Desmophyllum pertusum]|uniref:DUF3496 domain-containing protein n=1 Tax=Desmophyllum pertusum TaxID=174260 RepID=A0A9W9YJ27_9CNID|nr:hypothetical protein OS493_033131 [Desmophyllum pertusum]